MGKKSMWQLIIAGIGMVIDLVDGGLELLEAKAEAEEQKVIDDTRHKMQERATRAYDRLKRIKKAGG